jgi:hypothetical protein
VLTVAKLQEELQLMPPESVVEVWYPTHDGTSLQTDVDVTLQAVHDVDQEVVGLAVIATRPICFDPNCRARASLELEDRTGYRHRLCSGHAGLAWWADDGLRITAVFGGPGADGWSTAAMLLRPRWPDDPAIAAWAALPARWNAPLPQQPERP